MTTRIVRNPAVMGGQPCIEGTRMTTKHVAFLASSGYRNVDFETAFPDLTAEQIDAACRYERTPRRRIGRRVDALKVRLIRWLDESWGY